MFKDVGINTKTVVPLFTFSRCVIFREKYIKNTTESSRMPAILLLIKRKKSIMELHI